MMGGVAGKDGAKNDKLYQGMVIFDSHCVAHYSFLKLLLPSKRTEIMQ
jgi:hypothetical protein